MKYLREYKSESEIDSKYLEYVFADFIDGGSKIYDADFFWEISIDEPSIRVSGTSNIDDYIFKIESFNNFLLDIKSCISKVVEEFPSINYTMYVGEDGENNSWVNTIKRTISIRFNCHDMKKFKK